MRAPRHTLLLVLLAVHISAACGWLGSRERQIQRVLDAIADRLSHDQPLTPLAAAAAAGGLQDYLSPEVIVDLGAPSAAITGREPALAAATRLLAATSALQIEFVDVEVVAPASGGEAEPEQAEVTCSATAVIEDLARRETRDARELNLLMRRVDGRWVVERVKAVNVLEPVS